MKTSAPRLNRQKIRRLAGILWIIIFPVTFYYFSPYLSVLGAIQGTISGSICLFGLLFLSSLLVGRSFCAWGCPAGALLDLVATTQDRPLARNKLHWLKYLVWTPWSVMLIFLFVRAGSGISVDFFYATEAGFSVTSLPSLISYCVVVLVFYGVSALGGRRAPCHVFCWMAPFMIIGRKFSTSFHLPALCLHTSRTSCTGCHACTRNCPMSLPVNRMVQEGKPDHVDCILCGQCVDTCPQSCLALRWARPQTAGGVR